jgi:hypothetical protein
MSRRNGNPARRVGTTDSARRRQRRNALSAGARYNEQLYIERCAKESEALHNR